MADDKDIIKNQNRDKKNFDSVVNKLSEHSDASGRDINQLSIQQWIRQHWHDRKEKKADKERLVKEKEYFDSLTGAVIYSLDRIVTDLATSNVSLDSINNLVGLIADVIVEDAKPLWQYQKANLGGFEEFIKQQQEEGKNLDDHQDWEKRRANEAERKSLLGGTAAGGDGGDGTGGGGGLFGMGGGKGKGKGGWMAAGALATAALMRGATGIALMGFALSAFFGGLYLGDKTLAWLDADLKFDKIKEAAAGFSGILAELTPTAMTSLGALLLASTISGTGAAKSVGVMGFAISAFFVGLLAGDALIEGYTAIGGNLDFEGMKSVVKGFNSVIAEMSTATMISLGALVTAGIGISVLATKNKAVLITAAMGVTAMGAAIAGLFIGLALGDKIIEGTKLKDSTDLTGIKKVIGSIGEIVKSLDQATVTGLGVLILGGAGLGIASKNPLAAGIGVAALGAGIAGLFIGLAVADKTMSWMNVDFTQTAAAMKGFSDAMDNLSWRSIATLGTLMGAGGVLAVVTTTATKAKFIAAMGAISGGIAAFFTGFAVLDLASKWIGEGGGQAKKLIVNFGEAIDALSGKTLTTLGVLMGSAVIGGMFLPAVAGAVPAMGLIGAGIAAFFVAFDGLAAVADIIGVDGSSTKNLLINMSMGLSALNTIDGANLKQVGIGLGALTLGMTTFFSTKGIGAVFDFFISRPLGVAKEWWDSLFGIGDEPSIIEKMVNILMPIQRLNSVDLSGFNNAIGNLNVFADIEWREEADDFAYFVKMMVSKMPDLGKVDMSNLTKIQQILGSNLAEGQTLQNAIAMTNAGHPMIHAPSTQFNTSNSGTTLLNTMNKDTTAVTIPGDLSINIIHNARGMNVN